MSNNSRSLIFLFFVLTVYRWVDEVFAAIGADDFLLFALRECCNFEEFFATGVGASDSPNGSDNSCHKISFTL